MVQIEKNFIRMDRGYAYLKMAEILAERSTCTRAKVGCVITDVNKPISMGYNGSPPGMPHCIDNGCVMAEGHCISTIHAEMNAIIRVEKPGIMLVGYSTHAPCLACLKVGITKGITTWVYLTHYDDILRDQFIQWYNECNENSMELDIIQLNHVRYDNDFKSIVVLSQES